VFKHISIIHRPPNKSHEETIRYWKEVHTKVVKSRLPGLKKYVGNIALQAPETAEKQPGGGTQMNCDLIVELHFETLEDLRAALTSAPWLSDERKASSKQVIDYTNNPYVVMQEFVVPLDDKN
jgi:uncharacterized protein (TIGR02118 family)